MSKQIVAAVAFGAAVGAAVGVAVGAYLWNLVRQRWSPIGYSGNGGPSANSATGPRNGKQKSTSSYKNLSFYRNEIPCQPDGAKIDVILTWYGDYEKLKKTSYIQWLFPNKEEGRNLHASCLTEEEAKAIRGDRDLKKKVRNAFKMILDLYGMELTDNNGFNLKYDNPEHLSYFISHKESSMWVTRMLKALKELGHEELMLPWLKLLKKLIFVDGHLPKEVFKRSFHDYWLKTLDPADQDILTRIF